MNGFKIIDDLNDLAKTLKGEQDFKRWLVQEIVSLNNRYENDNSDYAKGYKDCLLRIRKTMCTLQPKNEIIFELNEVVFNE